MSATSVGTIVKKSVGLSIGLSILMIVAGLLAIAVPQAAGIAVNLLVAWLLIFSGASPSGVCVVYAHRRRTCLGTAARRPLYRHWRLPLGESCGGLGVTHARSGDLSVLRGESWSLPWDSSSARFRARVGCYSTGSSL